MDFVGVSYVFGQKDDNAWEAKGKLELKKENKTLSKDQLKTLFPKKGRGFQDDPENFEGTSTENDGDFWDFLDKDGSQIKETSDKESHLSRQWYTHVSDNRKNKQIEISKWSANLDDWWKHFFDDGTKWNISDVVKEIKGGWT